MKKNNTTNKLFILGIVTFLLLSQPVIAGKKFKCWTNNDGVKECGTYVPAEYSQKKIETRGESGRVIEVEDRAKSKAELAEIDRLAKLKEIEDAKIAEQNKKDSILLKTFTRERDINMLRDSKINVIEGIITVTNSNNKALTKKLEKLQKKAANIERRGKKPPARVLEDIKSIEDRISKNMKSIKTKRGEQEVIRAKFAKDLERFRALKNKKTKPMNNKPVKR
ncbi:MAG: hypothetical protein BMS9Abin31_0514 [Gammaproteobacteria bacterium]|nr:MAG: hypothetical protein BMS9Abin31_0514 [Gammaproteobacteria bacterium]